ncbi:MAG: hypothetical protein GX606_06305, partial [Elusimicrobia bacterium]|nr:hypothetical protein [Elusimicrobiota bacterium]
LPLDLAAFMRPPHKLCPFLHVPIQSGCDRTLSRMGRPYTTGAFLQMIGNVVSSVPGIMIGTDVIVGFPGETEADFEETRVFLQEAPVHFFHVFRYSKRLKARSRSFEEEVPSGEILRRSRILRDLGGQKQAAFLAGLAGSTQRALFEQKKNQYWIGRLANYVTIKTRSGRNLRNTLVDVRVDAVEDGCLRGTLVA